MDPDYDPAPDLSPLCGSLGAISYYLPQDNFSEPIPSQPDNPLAFAWMTSAYQHPANDL